MQVPSFDLVELQQGKNLDRLLNALQHIGFIYVKNHGISQNLVDSFFDQGQEFCNKPIDYKSQFRYQTETNSGWLNIGEERLNGQFTQLENKQAFNFRKDFDVQPPDPFTYNTVRELTKQCHKTCMDILRVYANALKIPQDFFVNRHRFEETSGDILRILHYPGIHDSHDSRVRAGGHSDFGSLTLLFTKSTDPGGLEIVEANTLDSFVPVLNLESHIIVNTGDLMEYWTCSFLRSTIHRVVVPLDMKLPRYTVAYFCHAEEETTLEKIDSPLIQAHETIERSSVGYEDLSVVKLFGKPKTAKEHLQMRLERIHVQV